MPEKRLLTGNGEEEKDTTSERIRKDIDESTTHEREEPDTDPPTDRQESGEE